MNDTHSRDRPAAERDRFTDAAIGVTVLATVITLASPYFGNATPAFRGSVVASSLVALVFAAQGARSLRKHGQPRLSSSIVVTVFGLWFVLAPIIYGTETVGFAPTAGVQFGGLLIASFGGYVAVEALLCLRVESRH